MGRRARRRDRGPDPRRRAPPAESCASARNRSSPRGARAPRPGAVLRGDVRSRPRTTTAGSRRPCARAGRPRPRPGRRRRSRRAQLGPPGRGARASRPAAQAGHADGHVALAMAPGRPKESAMTTAGRPGSAARSARAQASGSRGERTRASRRARWRRRRPRWRTRSRGGCGRSARRARRAHARRTRRGRPARGAGPCPVARRARARGRPGRRRQRAQRALGLRHDLVGHHEHVAGRSRSAARRAAARGGRRPARPRGCPPARGPVTTGLLTRARRASRPRVCAAPPVRAASESRSAWRSSAVSTSSTERRDLGDAQRRRLAWARLLVPLAAAGPEAGGDHVGRREQQRVRAAAVAVGHDDDGGRGDRAGDELVDLGGVQRRAVAGHEQHALEAALQRPVDAERGGVGVAAVVVVDVLGVVGARPALGAALAGHHDHVVDALARRSA